MHNAVSKLPFHALTHMSDDDTGRDARSKDGLVSTLVTAVVQGAANFLGDEYTRCAWNSRVSHLGFHLTKESLQSLREEALRDAGCNIQAELLLGSALLLFRYERGITAHHSDTRHRRFTKYIFTVLNVLYVYVGDEAFKIIPALSAQPPSGKIVRAATTSSWKGKLCEKLGEQVAFALLLHPDQRWRAIGDEFAFDPVTHIRKCVTGQVKTSRQLCDALGLSAIHRAQDTRTPEIWELPPPTLLPYDAEIFVCVQNGDLETTYKTLCSSSAHINVVDPYGLSLLYYAAYYCARACDLEASQNMCLALIQWGADTEWVDEIGNMPIYTMTDSAIIHFAMRTAQEGDITSVLLKIASAFGLSTNELLSQYKRSRGFNPMHLALLALNNPGRSLEERLLGVYMGNTFVDQPDNYGRSPLTWAVEYRWEEAIECLLSLRASVGLPRLSIDMRRSLPILQLAIAGPPHTKLVTIVKLLLDAGADIYERDDENWTALHVAASWGMVDVVRLLIQESDATRLLSARNAAGETAHDLARASGFCGGILSLLSISYN